MYYRHNVSVKNWHCFLILVFALMGCLGLSAAQAQTTVSATADAYVQDGSTAGTNYGAATGLYVKKNATAGANRWAYFKFPLTGAGGTITKAVLRLYGKNGGTGYSGADTVSGVTDTTWTETGLTWNNKPAAGSALASATVTSTAQYVQWDVTSFVKSRQTAGAAAVSLVATMNAVPGTGQADNFNSRENSSSKPQLVLTVSTAAPHATVSPTALQYNTAQNAGPTTPQTVSISNTGTAAMNVTGIALSGTDAASFVISQKPTLPATVAAGGSVTIGATFSPTTLGVKSAQINVTTTDPNNATLAVTVRGLAARSLSGKNEASLQWILDTFQIPINVGSPDPTYSTMPGTSPLGDEVLVPRFQKAGPGNVTMQVLACFGAQDPASGLDQRFGWYEAANAAGTHQLFTIANAYAQTLNPVTSGTTSFDPGTTRFGFYGQWPYWTNTYTYQEDYLNAFGTNTHHYVRVYVYKDKNGNVVPNTYLVASGDGSPTPNYNDDVFIVSNVMPATGTLSVQNLDGVPYPDRFIFNRIQTPADAEQHVHDTATLRLTNTGLDPVVVGSLPVVGPWTLPTPPPLPDTLAPGDVLDVPMQFVATSTRISTGSLTVQTNIPDQSSIPVTLAGFWQNLSEHSQEPTIYEIFNSLYGYQTNTGFTAYKLPINQGGDLKAIGDEVLSPYWVQADTTVPVSVRQMNAFHTYRPPSKNAALYWFKQSDKPSILANETASPPVKSKLFKKIFSQNADDSQSLLPRLDGSTTLPAAGSLSPGVAFGLDVDYWSSSGYAGESSDADLTDHKGDLANGCTEPCGHHMRFYPLKGRDGLLVPNTYIMTIDYSAANYDFNDVTYLLTNIMPAATP